ncbi:AlpA family phage regulatory protein [Candidatus Kaiserbacteria bacterium]|nr:AlpA family phage regulatory protein [Candidatus Kaiserbacteria bacterium]
MNQFCELCGISRSTAYRLRKTDPDFPRPLDFGTRSKRYLESECNQYIYSKLQCRGNNEA